MAPRESLREAQKQFTHERLLKAAVDEFTLKGYNATTVDDIVVRAGATRATFYLHFKGKADMILELMENDTEFRPRWDALRDLPRKPSRARIREWLVATTQAWEANRELITVIYQGVASEPELSAGAFQRAQEVLNRFVASIRHLGWEDDAHAHAEAMLLFAQLERTFTYWNFEDDTGERTVVLDLLTENWWAAFNRAAKAAQRVPAGQDALARPHRATIE